MDSIVALAHPILSFWLPPINNIVLMPHMGKYIILKITIDIENIVVPTPVKFKNISSIISLGHIKSVNILSTAIDPTTHACVNRISSIACVDPIKATNAPDCVITVSAPNTIVSI